MTSVVCVIEIVGCEFGMPFFFLFLTIDLIRKEPELGSVVVTFRVYVVVPFSLPVILRMYYSEFH